MKTLILISALTATTAAAQDLPGYDQLTFDAPHHARAVAGAIWYPAGSTTYRSEIGADVVFQGIPALVGPMVRDGQFPLVVISHGSGGNIDKLGWLAAGLVEQGAIVVGINHPGSTSGDSSPRRSVQHWTRVMDFSAALDQILADPTFAPHIDVDAITALGFSMGGATALQMGGLQLDLAQYQAYCAEWGDAAADCVYFGKGGVDFSALDPVEYGQSLRDDRISATIAVDPGLTYGFAPDSFAAVNSPVTLINLGQGTDRAFAVDVGPNGSDLAAQLDATYLEVSPASHFTFLAECTEIGAMILADEGEDPICTDPDGVNRNAVHAQLIEKIAAHIAR